MILVLFCPVVVSEFFCISKSASSAGSFLHMERTFSTTSACGMGFFTTEMRCSSFCHKLLFLLIIFPYYGDTYIILSPRRMIVLCFATDSPFCCSSAFFKTRFICGTSYPSRTPLYERPDRSSTMTLLLSDPCNIFNGLSIIVHLAAGNMSIVYKGLGRELTSNNWCY